LLHVHPDEVAEAGRMPDERLHVLVGELLVEVEPQVRELERDVRLQLLRGDPVEHFPVRVHDGAALVRRVHVLAEQRRVRQQALLVEPPEHGDELLERLAGDETRRAEPHPVLADEVVEPRAVGEREDRLPRRRVCRLGDHASAGTACSPNPYLTTSCLTAFTSSSRLTARVCGAPLTVSGSSAASRAIASIASANSSSVSFASVSVGSIISASGTTSGKYTVGGWKL